MRQRVAVARTLAMSPEILLLDEPLSALDALTRAKLQDEIERIWSAEKKTVVLITNDVDEALLLADRVIPLNPGPNASLGPSFKVDLTRPRKRSGRHAWPDATSTSPWNHARCAPRLCLLRASAGSITARRTPKAVASSTAREFSRNRPATTAPRSMAA